MLVVTSGSAEEVDPLARSSDEASTGQKLTGRAGDGLVLPDRIAQQVAILVDIFQGLIVAEALPHFLGALVLVAGQEAHPLAVLPLVLHEVRGWVLVQLAVVKGDCPLLPVGVATMLLQISGSGGTVDVSNRSGTLPVRAGHLLEVGIVLGDGAVGVAGLRVGCGA